MIRRCTNPKSHRWDSHGERGIEVCERWLTSFEAFCADMGPRPSSKHSLDREDNDGNYEPGNCRWATRRQQALNRRDSVKLTIRDLTLTIREWAQRGRVSARTIGRRRERGWPDEDAVFMRRRQGSRPVTAV